MADVVFSYEVMKWTHVVVTLVQVSIKVSQMTLVNLEDATNADVYERKQKHHGYEREASTDSVLRLNGCVLVSLTLDVLRTTIIHTQLRG